MKGSAGSACCIVGAGYSHLAGLPLAGKLLDADVAVVSKGARKRFELVWRDYDAWRRENAARHAEEYLGELYRHERSWPAPPFSCAVELVAAVLATPRGYSSGPTNPRYGVRITQPSRCRAHRAFWMAVWEMFDDLAVVTTNYDLLIEQSLRHRPMKRVFGPGCYYGGLGEPQVLKGRAQPFTVKDPQRYVELTGSVPVYKLHGSLNWGRGTGGLELCQDMHPAFISGGNAAIVPPVTEKERPHWLRSVWEGAERALARSRCWIVCGYSLPSYDMGMRDALRTASGGELERVFILDPRSKVLRDDYKEVVGDTSVCCLAGLPRGIEELRMAVGADRGAVFADAQRG